MSKNSPESLHRLLGCWAPALSRSHDAMYFFDDAAIREVLVKGEIHEALKGTELVDSFTRVGIPDPDRLYSARCHQSRLALESRSSHRLTVIYHLVFLKRRRMVQGAHSSSQADCEEIISVTNGAGLAFMKVDARQPVVPLSI